MEKGYFVISLDFELFWGVRDSISFESYQQNILGVRQAIPEMLSLFDKYSINCTFATVGFLFAKDKDELSAHLPHVKPSYKNLLLSPYTKHINQIGNSEDEDPYHYGLSLINEIRSYGHEIGSHTFSHYYCLEEGQTLNSFQADLQAWKNIVGKFNIDLRSLVFPKNQYSLDHLKICKESTISAFRGNENSWLYRPTNKNNKLKRIIRLVDSYVNLSGHHCYDKKYMISFQPYNIPSSRFLRPYNKKISWLDFLKKRRILKSMTYAAKNNLTYHLWWHPHNFGKNVKENMVFLEHILHHFVGLKNKYNFTNTTMEKLTEELNEYEKQ